MIRPLVRKIMTQATTGHTPTSVACEAYHKFKLWLTGPDQARRPNRGRGKPAPFERGAPPFQCVSHSTRAPLSTSYQAAAVGRRESLILCNPFRVGTGLVLSALPRVALRLPWAIISSPFGARQTLKTPKAELTVERYCPFSACRRQFAGRT
jgi:hypothetical protein